MHGRFFTGHVRAHPKVQIVCPPITWPDMGKSKTSDKYWIFKDGDFGDFIFEIFEFGVGVKMPIENFRSTFLIL